MAPALVAGQEQEPVRIEEEVLVEATRTNRRIEDDPQRVEVIEREEIEEKLLMTPGDIVMMLNEMGGMRVQATSPSLGAASVRVQGMRGRYTRFLSDGLPLFGEQVGALGLLQIPPMDLGRVEVIKGVASSLYGAGAMGGVVNLIARRPEDEREIEALFNQSTRGATDVIGWLAGPMSSGWSGSLLAGGHFQRESDVDDDRWADLPGYSRGVIRPRFFWDGGGGRRAFVTTGVTVESREGGSDTYVEALDTTRADAGAMFQTIVRESYVLTFRGAAAQQRHDHRFGEVLERDRHDTLFGEVAVRGAFGAHTWVAGGAVEYDAYRPQDVPRFAYRYTIPGVFVQDDIELTPWAAVSGSARLDHHSEYGSFLSPRGALLLRAGGWSSRLSAGLGFFGPSALTEETEAAGLTRLQLPGALRAERGRSLSVDLTRTQGPMSATVTLFASQVEHPIHVSRDEAYALTNLDDPATNRGVELLGTFRQEPFSVTASYAYVRARERVGGVEDDVALTPRHSAGLVGMWEREGVGRVGVEWYFTGRQRLEVNPYRARSAPYSVFGVLVERQLGRLRLFVNGENLTGVRQTNWDRLLRPARGVDGRWTVDAWAPLDGRTVNGGLRVSF
ncbi:MAG: TonB-dependent receptor plug domain-containing protein [Vicinamibacterales bacterium]